MLRRSLNTFSSTAAVPSSTSGNGGGGRIQPFTSRKPHHQIKDTFFKKYSPLDERKRIVVLIDAEHISVHGFFGIVQPALQREFSSATHNVLLHRIFGHSFKRDWQQVLVNREDSFDHVLVERFISLHMQMAADAAHIAQRRLQNKAQGVVLCCADPLAPLLQDQLRKREIFSFVDKCVITASGKISLNYSVGAHSS